MGLVAVGFSSRCRTTCADGGAREATVPGGGGVLPAMGGVLALPVAPSRLGAPDVVAGGDAAGGGHDVRARNAAALPAGGADMPGAAVPRAVAAADTAVAVAGAAALTVVVGLLAVTGDLLALCAAAGAVLAASVEVTPP